MHRSLVSIVLVLLPGLSGGAEWPQFRGPDATGVSTETGLPDSWSPTENVVWKVAVAGRGWSSPIVWGEKIFLTTAVSEGGDDGTPKKGLYFGGNRDAPPSSPHRWVILCLDWKTGKVLWERTAQEGVPSQARHIKNTFASETPVTDGQAVYAYFGDVGLFAFDMEGKPLWSRSLGSFKTRYAWGGAASPVLHAGRVYVVNDNEERSFMAAFDKSTGEEAWRIDRNEKSNWATPFVWRNKVRTEIVTSGTGKVRSYDLDGKVLWELGGLSSITIPTPFAQKDLLFVGSGYVMDEKRPIFAVRPGASGDITLKEGESSSASIAWWGPKASPYNPSPIVYGDHFYVLLDRGFFSAHEAATGKPVYDKQRLGEATAFTASPWAYEGKVFCLSEDGDTFVVQAGPEFKVLRTNALGEMCMATPAIARKSLIIRTIGHLYRIEKAGG